MAEATVTVDAHLPVRPTWGCSCGAAEWPDEAARQSLRTEYRGAGASLGVYLADRWFEAVDDLTPAVDVRDLYDRMLGWLREA